MGPRSCPGMRSAVLPVIDEWGRVRGRVGIAFYLKSCFILARNSIYLFLKVCD